MGSREDVETNLRAWAATNADRDRLVREAHAAGISPHRIHTLTGIGRSTIYRILEAAMPRHTELYPNTITADLVHQLATCPAVDPALVRYSDGHYEVRSTIPTGDAEIDDYTVIIAKDGLGDIDQTGEIDFEHLTDEDARDIATVLLPADPS